MVKIYEELRDGTGVFISGRTKLFIINADSNGEIGEYLSGVACVPEGNGTMFIVDDWLIPQIDKLQFTGGTLSVKDGEELTPPVKTEKELKREELERQLAELENAEDEPAYIEEQPDEIFKEYDEIINDDFRQEPAE